MSQSQAKPEDRRLMLWTLEEIQRLPFSLRNEKLAAWDAAPSDPVGAIDRALTSLSGDLHLERIEARNAILAKLGVPFAPVDPGNTT